MAWHVPITWGQGLYVTFFCGLPRVRLGSYHGGSPPIKFNMINQNNNMLLAYSHRVVNGVLGDVVKAVFLHTFNMFVGPLFRIFNQGFYVVTIEPMV